VGAASPGRPGPGTALSRSRRLALGLLSLLLLGAADGGPAPLPEALPPGAPIGVPVAPGAPPIRRVEIDPRRLEPELRRVAAEADRAGARVLVELGAPWCEPCRALDAAFARETNRSVLAAWWLVEVNVDLLPPGRVLGLSSHTVPVLVRLTRSGRPEASLRGAALPTDSAPALDAALRRFLSA